MYLEREIAAPAPPLTSLGALAEHHPFEPEPAEMYMSVYIYIYRYVYIYICAYTCI